MGFAGGIAAGFGKGGLRGGDGACALAPMGAVDDGVATALAAVGSGAFFGCGACAAN